MIGEMVRISSILISALLAANVAHGQRDFRSSSRFEPPAESFRAPTTLDTIQDLLERKNFTEAAAQIESLLKSNSDDITPSDERSLISISSWLDTISLRHGKNLTPAYSAQFDAAAKQAVDDLRKDPSATPERFYLLAKRYRFSSIAPDSYIEAADREPNYSQLESQLEAEDLLKMIDGLPTGYRIVFNMFAIDGYSHKEIATHLGINENTSKSQLSRARALLQRNCLESENEIKRVKNK